MKNNKPDYTRRYLPMICSFRHLNGYQDDDGSVYYGLSAPFPVNCSSQLDMLIKNAKLSGLDLIFAGFFDPLSIKKNGHYDGGFVNAGELVPIDSALSFGDYLKSLGESRGLDLLYNYETQKEG